jgi:hypothetical protein
MSSREPYRTTLAYALALVSGKNELAARLRVTVPMLDNWLAGIDDVPDRIFMAAVDVVIESSVEARSRSRELLTRLSTII